MAPLLMLCSILLTIPGVLATDKTAHTVGLLVMGFVLGLATSMLVGWLADRR